MHWSLIREQVQMTETLSGGERLQNKLLCINAVSFVSMVTSESESCEDYATVDKGNFKQMNSSPTKKSAYQLLNRLQTMRYFLM